MKLKILFGIYKGCELVISGRYPIRCSLDMAELISTIMEQFLETGFEVGYDIIPEDAPLSTVD